MRLEYKSYGVEINIDLISYFVGDHTNKKNVITKLIMLKRIDKLNLTKIESESFKVHDYIDSNCLLLLPFGCPLSCVNGSGLFCLPSSSLLSFCSRNVNKWLRNLFVSTTESEFKRIRR
ncbi:hypothetical protein DERF_012592 [Dermatophagoides farinae]|uniref:Uncharacterized protein n=1 Tax=Dermatophagoides farinae TaxID=6954 RepID=A0A922HPV4_DERFA|nr:hypothetical protein DERF_012592 [Dermatophagoides farinae]